MSDIKPPEIENTTPIVYSNYQSVKHFCLLSFFSLGLYPFFWFFKHWQYLKEEKGLNISPSYRTTFTLLYGYSLFNKFELLAMSKGYKKNIPLFLCFISFIVFSICFNLKNNLLSYIIVFSFVFLIPVHRMMNFYYLQEQKDLAHRTKLSKGEKRFLLYFWLIFIAIGILGVMLD